MPEDSKGSSTLWSLTRGHRLRYAAAIGALAAATALGLLVPLAGKRAIDAVAAAAAGNGPAPVGRLAGAAVAVVLLTTLSGVFVYLRGRWSAAAAEGVALGLRDRLFDHLQRLPAAYHDRADTGDLVQRATSDVETVRLFLAVQVVEVGRAVLMVVAVLPLLLRLDPGMTLVSVCLFPALIGSALVFFRRVRARFLDADQAEAAMTSCLHENLTGIRVVRAFARQELERRKFAGASGEYRDRSLRLIRLHGGFWALSDLLAVGQIGLVALVGAERLRAGSIGAGTLFAFLSYVYLLIAPVRHLGRVLADMGKAVVALGRIREILEVAPEDDGETEPVAGDGSSGRGRLVVRGLGYRHGAGAGPMALDGVSFSVEPGETLAILGPPGAGKSTLIHLLLRLYDYEQGSIDLDGRELRTLRRSFVRSRIGAVLQEPFLFSRTLRENLLLGRPGAGEEAAIESARTAGVHDTILGFEHGYDTPVGERGVTLSGGQRQRLALARALLRDPPVLVLDDALSAVDTATEARILAALRARHGRRTTIVIAHRLTTLRTADRVLVLEGGRVVQIGTHDELAAVAGPYRRLWRIQSSLEQEIDEELGGGATASVGGLRERTT